MVRKTLSYKYWYTTYILTVIEIGIGVLLLSYTLYFHFTFQPATAHREG